MKTFRNDREFGVGCDERRREQHMIALAAVYGSAHGVEHQAARHGFTFDPRM